MILLFIYSLKIFLYIFSSISKSKAFVASSNINKSGFLYKARAIPILCFCPADINTPFSPKFVLYPSVRFNTKSSNSAIFITFEK